MTTARSAMLPISTRPGARSGERPWTNVGRRWSTSGSTVPASTMSQRSNHAPRTFAAAAQGDKRDRGGGRGERGRQKQAAQGPGVAPHGLVAHAEEHAGVPGDKEAERRPQDHERAPHRAAEHAADHAVGPARLRKRAGREDAED